MALKRRQFAYDKANWKKRVKRVSNKADEMLAEAKAGSRLSLGEIFELAHELHDVGSKATELSGRAGALNMHRKVQREIAYLARIMSLYSQTLHKYADDMGFPVRTYPLFVSELDLVVPRDTVIDPMDDLDRVLGEDNE
jgi:hypothetical protein